jgi:hypothetical protein
MGKLSHDDWCKLSQAFWRGSGHINIDQLTRINDYLKEQIACAAEAEKPHKCFPVSIGELGEICGICGKDC